jgi:hypothetical protein
MTELASVAVRGLTAAGRITKGLRESAESHERDFQ